MNKYVTTVGLEIHAELKTATKMFCNSKNDPDETKPNSNVCAVCMGHPGTLPVINKEAVKHVLKMGLAVGGELADFTEFDRKNYYYPDIPKAYQLSQYKYPLVKGGELAGVKLTRIHLEEDTASSTHDAGKTGDAAADNFSLVDFNRAGVPLMELVTEPVIHTPEQAGKFARELQLLLQYLGAGEANMEKGEMRVEANISVSTDTTGDPKKFGTKVEVKNLNSFRSVERAIAYEVERHIRILESGGENGQKIVQETRGWDEQKQVTFSQRAKEDSHDYRYFPDPDLPKLYVSEIPDFRRENLLSEMPELPSAKRTRYQSELGVKEADIEVFINNQKVALFFESVLKRFGAQSGASTGGAKDAENASRDNRQNGRELSRLAANYIVSDLMGLAKNIQNPVPEMAETSETTFGKATPEGYAELIKMIAAGDINSRGAKDTLAILFAEGGSPKQIAEKNGFIQKMDEGELKTVMASIIAANPAVVADYKAGKAAALQFFIGQGMKATKGSANPEILKKVTLGLL